MKKILKLKAFLILTLLITGASCQKEYEKEYNWAYPLSGEWTVNVKYGEEIYGPIFIKTYNSSFGQDSIWIDDNGNFWPFKAKAKVDINGLNFETSNFTSYSGGKYEDLVTIRNAKVIKTDSIYFEIEFGSDPGTLYHFSGHRRVSYDEYMSH